MVKYVRANADDFGKLVFNYYYADVPKKPINPIYNNQKTPMFQSAGEAIRYIQESNKPVDERVWIDGHSKTAPNVDKLYIHSLFRSVVNEYNDKFVIDRK